jgi:hypothetical protein
VDESSKEGICELAYGGISIKVNKAKSICSLRLKFPSLLSAVDKSGFMRTQDENQKGIIRKMFVSRALMFTSSVIIFLFSFEVVKSR